MERVPGIEPGYSAWKAAALPLSYTRILARVMPSSGAIGKLIYTRVSEFRAAFWRMRGLNEILDIFRILKLGICLERRNTNKAPMAQTSTYGQIFQNYGPIGAVLGLESRPYTPDPQN